VPVNTVWVLNGNDLYVDSDSPQKLNIDIHFAKIVHTIEKYDIQRMVIDGMTSYSTALQDQAVYRDFFRALVAYSKHRLMTTFFSYENPAFLGLSAFMPDFPVSSIVDNIILLNQELIAPLPDGSEGAGQPARIR
jgi:circadian clock protein KaiC